MLPRPYAKSWGQNCSASICHFLVQTSTDVVDVFHCYMPKKRENPWLEFCRRVMWIEVELESIDTVELLFRGDGKSVKLFFFFVIRLYIFFCVLPETFVFDQTVGCIFFLVRKKNEYEIDECCLVGRFHSGNVCKIAPDETRIARHAARWGVPHLGSQKMAKRVPGSRCVEGVAGSTGRHPPAPQGRHEENG